MDDSIDDLGITRKHSVRVTVPGSGRQMYKATLTSLLNQDPTLSHDRYVLQPQQLESIRRQTFEKVSKEMREIMLK